MKTRLATALLLVISLLTTADALSAQRRGGSAPPVDRAELERRLREGFERYVREQLTVDSLRARELSDVLLGFQEERVQLQRRESDLRRRLQTQGRSEQRGGARLPDEQARALLDEMQSIQNAEAEIFNREHERLLQLLSPAQLVSFHLRREQIAELLQRVRRSAAGGP